jgi:5-formyltetrahydrofolate cyclo-ligase
VSPSEDPADISAEKRSLRERVRATRDATDPDHRRGWSERICHHLLRECDLAAPASALSYAGFGSEIDTLPFNRALLDRGLSLVLPRVERVAGGLVLYRVRDLETDLIPGVWGIPEPDPLRCAVVSPDDIDWLLLPGLAFDRRGGRLGYGGGYYDRLLPRLPRLKRIAAAFDCQIVDAVPRGSHDVLMDRVITETGAAFPPAG